MIWQFLKVKTEHGESITLVSVKIRVIFLISKQCGHCPTCLSDCNCIQADLWISYGSLSNKLEEICRAPQVMVATMKPIAMPGLMPMFQPYTLST